MAEQEKEKPKVCPECGYDVDDQGITTGRNGYECCYWGKCPDTCETCEHGYCDQSC